MCDKVAAQQILTSHSVSLHGRNIVLQTGGVGAVHERTGGTGPVRDIGEFGVRGNGPVFADGKGVHPEIGQTFGKVHQSGQPPGSHA